MSKVNENVNNTNKQNSSSKSCCEDVDTFGISCCNYSCLFLDYLCIPFHFCCQYIAPQFERPYSFCFILNFFILVTPLLLLLIILIQNSKNPIDNINTFYFILYFLFLNLLINFLIGFYIYYVYGIHRVEKEKEVTYQKNNLFTKYVFNYITNITYVLPIGIYYFVELIALIICWVWVSGRDLDKLVENQSILIDFTRFALICNTIYLVTSIILYVYLFFLLNCKISNSCVCKVISNIYSSQNDLENNSANVNKQLDLSPENNNDVFFISKSLKFFKFFGLYDVEKSFPQHNDSDKIIKIENE
jgi:hypothetical protein